MATQPRSPQGQEYDPFGQSEPCPAISFKHMPIGTTYQGVITQLPEEIQDRDYSTQKPLYWDTGQPKMVVVLRILCRAQNGDEEERSVWAKKPSNLFRAIGSAQKEAGARLALGGTLAIRLVGEQATGVPRQSPQKLYEARYTPPVAEAAGSDPWGDTAYSHATPAQPARQPQSSAPASGAKPAW